MKKRTLILAASVVAVASSCQPQKPMHQEKKEMNDDSNYHDRRTKKSCGSCEADKAQEPQKAIAPAETVAVPQIKGEEKKEVIAEVKAPPEAKVEKAETAAAPEVKVEKAETAAAPEVKVEKTN